MDFVFYFMLYAFGGWVLEHVYSKVTTGAFLEEGFLKGPFKPMYGVALVILLLVLDSRPHWSVVLVLCFIVPSAVEYISGLLLEKLFHRQWWDYKDHRFQVGGHICMRFSIYWMILSLFVINVLHPASAALYQFVSPVWMVLCPLFLIYFGADMMITCRLRRKQALLLGFGNN